VHFCVQSDCLLLLSLLQFWLILINLPAFSIVFNMSSSPKQPHQFPIDALPQRLDYQDERFHQLESKLDHLIRAFEKSPMYDQPKASPHIIPD